MQKRGTISLSVVSNPNEALTSRLRAADQISSGGSVGGFKVCCARHKTFGAFGPRKRLAHTGERGGKRV